MKKINEMKFLRDVPYKNDKTENCSYFKGVVSYLALFCCTTITELINNRELASYG